MAEAASERKLYLAKNVSFTVFPVKAGDRWDSTHTITGSSGWISKPPVVVPGNPLCDKLTAIFKDEPLKWRITLQVHCVPTYASNSYPRIPETELRVTLESTRDIGRELRAVLGKDVALQALIAGVAVYQNGDRLPPTLGRDLVEAEKIKTREMTVPPPQDGIIVCLDVTFNPRIFALLTTAMKSSSAGEEPIVFKYHITGKMTLAIIAKDEVVPGPPEGQNIVVNQRSLEEEELAPDLVIVAGNGAEVKCHRGILAVHSQVFRTMFEEAKTQKIEMSDVSEASVRAFLAYLYHWDASKAEESCTVALEMLKAGHKYDIPLLENNMRKLVMSKPAEWFEMEVTLRLYLFVHNLDPDREALKMKAVTVLKLYASNLKGSPIYRDMFRENPEAAMDLFQYAVSS